MTGRFTLEGPNLIREALRAGIVPEAIFYTRRYLEKSEPFFSMLPGQVKRYLLTPQLFKNLALTDSPQEVAALAPVPVSSSGGPVTGKVKLGLLLDRLQDPGNLGTIIRTAATSGADGVYYSSGTVDPYSPKVLRSTAGAVFHLSPVFVPDPLQWLDEQKEQGVQIMVTGPGQGRYYWETDLRPPTVFIIGNESQGVAPELAIKGDLRVTIPQPGWGGSLNAAVAAAIILYETLRQRSQESG